MAHDAHLSRQQVMAMAQGGAVDVAAQHVDGGGRGLGPHLSMVAEDPQLVFSTVSRAVLHALRLGRHWRCRLCLWIVPLPTMCLRAPDVM